MADRSRSLRAPARDLRPRPGPRHQEHLLPPPPAALEPRRALVGSRVPQDGPRPAGLVRRAAGGDRRPFRRRTRTRCSSRSSSTSTALLRQVVGAAGPPVASRGAPHAGAVSLALGAVPRVWGDSYYLGDAFASLLENALEAAAPAGKVLVRSYAGRSARRPRAVVEFIDNGAGMSAEFLRDRLFRPFETTKPQGVGPGARDRAARSCAFTGARSGSSPSRAAGRSCGCRCPASRSRRERRPSGGGPLGRIVIVEDDADAARAADLGAEGHGSPSRRRGTPRTARRCANRNPTSSSSTCGSRPRGRSRRGWTCCVTCAGGTRRRRSS